MNLHNQNYQAPVLSNTPWAAGRLDCTNAQAQLLFGRMHEDASLECEVFEQGGRAFCIGSAGCTAMALAQEGYRVTAVDINPAQIDYFKKRLAGMPAGEGHIDAMMQHLRRLLPWLGLTSNKLEQFLMLEEPAEQLEFWMHRLSTVRMRLAMKWAFGKGRLKKIYDDRFLACLPDGFDSILWQRLCRGFGRHANRTNSYAWRLLLGREAPGSVERKTAGTQVDLVCADAAEYLETCPTNSFDAFSLSNILDGASGEYADRLWAAVHRAGKPGAVAVIRSLSQPKDADEAEWAARDRSLIWGAIGVVHLGEVSETSAMPARSRPALIGV
jgi:S-adenosylmethionine:diacylglycerol 3-amino-3-carboxypropyl transferase